MNDTQMTETKTSTFGNTYSETKGTGVLSTLIFGILVFAVMFLIAMYKGY